MRFGAEGKTEQQDQAHRLAPQRRRVELEVACPDRNVLANRLDDLLPVHVELQLAPLEHQTDPRRLAFIQTLDESRHRLTGVPVLHPDHRDTLPRLPGGRLPQDHSGVRTPIKVADEPDTLHLYFTGDGFLRQMVRNLAGTIIEVARGKRSIAELSAILQAREKLYG